MRIRFTEHGEGDPVLLLHGSPASRPTCGATSRRSAGRGRRAIAIDLRLWPLRQAARRLLQLPLPRSRARRLPRGRGRARPDAGLVHDLGGPFSAFTGPRRIAAGRAPGAAEHAGLGATIIGRGRLRPRRISGVRSYMTSQSGLAASRCALECTTAAAFPTRRSPPTWRRSPATTRARRSAARPTPCTEGVQEDVERWLPEIRGSIPAPSSSTGSATGSCRNVATSRWRRSNATSRDLVEVTVLEDCGHFCQEERPTEIGVAFCHLLRPRTGVVRKTSGRVDFAIPVRRIGKGPEIRPKTNQGEQQCGSWSWSRRTRTPKRA